MIISSNYDHFLHSGSFAGLSFLSLYLSGKIRAFDRRGHVAKLCIVFLPLLIASLVGVSRVDDYRHHWQDVFAGGVLGISLSLSLRGLICFFLNSNHDFFFKRTDSSFRPGIVVAAFCYLQFFPAPHHSDGK